jgi:hypothetical protein
MAEPVHKTRQPLIRRAVAQRRLDDLGGSSTVRLDVELRAKREGRRA